MSLPLHLGTLVISDGDELREIRGESAGGVPDQRGSARIFRVEGPSGLTLEVADVTWDNQERDVRLVSRFESPEIYDLLKDRLRQGILRRNSRMYVELSQARLKEPTMGKHL